MELTRIILGPVTTEKSELQKEKRTYTLRVAPEATKIDVKNALRKYYDVDAVSVRVMRIGPKKRVIGAGKVMVKRKPWKKMLVTLSSKSKALDLVQFKSA